MKISRNTVSQIFTFFRQGASGASEKKESRPCRLGSTGKNPGNQVEFGLLPAVCEIITGIGFGHFLSPRKYSKIGIKRSCGGSQ